MEKKIELSIVIPAYNEERAISSVVDEIKSVMGALKKQKYYEIIVVDDGSEDRTVEIVKGINGVRLIQHPTNKGYGAALKTGIKNANGELILITDADGTYPIKEISSLLNYIGGYDMVVGARVDKKVNIPLSRKPGKFILSLLANYLSERKIPDLNSGFRVFRKDTALKFFNLFPSGFSFTTIITLAYLCNEYTVKYVTISYQKRVGSSKINVIRDGMRFITLIISTIVYFNPLKVFLPLSTLLFLTGSALLLYKLIFTAYSSTVGVILILSSIQIAFLGFLADLINKRLGG